MRTANGMYGAIAASQRMSAPSQKRLTSRSASVTSTAPARSARVAASVRKAQSYSSERSRNQVSCPTGIAGSYPGGASAMPPAMRSSAASRSLWAAASSS